MTTNTPEFPAGMLNTDPAASDLPRSQSASRSWLAAGLTLTAIILMVISAILFRPANRLIDNPPLLQATALAILGGIALLGAMKLSPNTVQAGRVAENALEGGRLRWVFIVPGLLLLAVGTEMSARVLKTDWFQVAQPTLQFFILLAGLVLFMMGMIGVRRLSIPRVQWAEALPLLAILALALFVRVVGLDTLIRWSVDEMHFALGANEFFYIRTPSDLLTTTSNYLPPAMIYSYWNAGTVAVWGHNFVGLRMLNAILGTATVLASYGVGRALFDRRTALIAALLIATFPPHIHFSRISMGQIGDALFGTMAIMFAARAFRWNRRADWVFMGVCIGLTQYFYEGGRLLFPPLFACWIILMAVVLRKKFAPLRRGLVLMTVTILVVIIPVYFTMWYTGAPFGSRMNESQTDVSIFSRGLRGELDSSEQASLVRRLTDPFLTYVFNPDITGEFYSGREAMILRFFVPIFLLGVFHTVWRLKSANTLLVPALLAASAGNILIANPFMYHRYIMVMPAAAIIVAIGLRATLPMLNPFPKRDPQPDDAPQPKRSRWARAGAGLAFALAGVIAVTQLYYYFNHLVPEHAISARRSKGYDDAADAIQRYLEMPEFTSENSQMFLLDRNSPDVHVPRHLLGFLRGSPRYPLQAVDTTDVTQSYFTTLPRNRHYVFFVEPGDTRTIQMLEHSFVLSAPQFTPWNDLPVNKAYVMFIARMEDNAMPLDWDDNANPNPPITVG